MTFVLRPEWWGRVSHVKIGGNKAQAEDTSVRALENEISVFKKEKSSQWGGKMVCKGESSGSLKSRS